MKTIISLSKGYCLPFQSATNNRTSTWNIEYFINLKHTHKKKTIIKLSTYNNVYLAMIPNNVNNTRRYGTLVKRSKNW